MKNFKKIIAFLLLTITLLGVPMLAKLITNKFDFSTIDPDNVFLWFMVRHSLQALMILIIVIFLRKGFNLNFNLGIGDKKIGLSYLKKFVIIFTIGCLVFNGLLVLLKQFQPFIYEHNFTNIVGYMSFQLFFTGPSEEFIFRAFAMTVFIYFISNKRLNKKISYANLYAAIIFGLAHISITFSPFSLSYAIPQIITSLILGYFYGDCYEKSKSVIYPMIMHSFTNVLMVSVTIILSIVF
ncbi:MAG: CPBP family intramembrane glutamic endopeptidase [Bacilli bacterium]|jgi:membrane protease YdiL (CAAX protease family)